MLNPTVDSISSMSRSYFTDGVQQNPAYYSPNTLSSIILIVFLFFLFLTRNDILPAIKSKKYNFSKSLAGLFITLIILLMVSRPEFDFSPAKGMPFILIGTPVMLTLILALEDIDLVKLVPQKSWMEKSSFQSIHPWINTILIFVIFISMSINISFLPPIISSDIPFFLSIILLAMALFVFIQIYSESGNPLVHDRRNSTMILIIALPLILYLTTRLLFLLKNPDSVTRERWDLSWSFMDMKNTFEINAWPIQPDFPDDDRWKFLYAAILNSGRATILSIVFCTILGVLIGVTRLSSNKLASSLATVYVEVFRNMPLAVLLFLIMLQLGESLPLFQDEANIAGWIYYSNQGIFIPRPETARMLMAVAIVLSLWGWSRYRDREGVDDSEEALAKKTLIWSLTLSICLGIILTGDMSLPNYVKPNEGIPGSWNIEDGSAFEITKSFLALIIGLTLFTAAVVAEIVRGSIQALPRGQIEASISLGLSSFQRLRLVILPQALRSMIPLLNSQYMNVWKNSSLAIIVAYSDIFYVIFVMMNNVGKLIPLFLLLLVIYQTGSLIISGIMNFFNSRVTRVKI
jgi:general L-amino acid transport system permease protein